MSKLFNTEFGVDDCRLCRGAARRDGANLCRVGGESGQILLLTALFLPILMGLIALSVDVGLMFRAERQMQSAADSAVIAAVQELRYDDVTAAAKTDAALNGVIDGTNGARVTVNNPPANGPMKGVTGFVEVIVSQPQPTFFMKVFNRGSMTVAARAVATLGTNNNCVYALSPTGTLPPPISASNGVNVQIAGCAVFANSNSNGNSLEVTGGATFTASAINLVGGSSVSNGGHLTPSTPNTGAAPISDPLAYLQPPTFNASNCVTDPIRGQWGNFRIGPGSSTGTICYNGLNIANGATVTLNPGMYIINGTLSLAGGTTTTGSGVTFYFPPGSPGGKLSISNGITFNLTAPTSGTYNGILFYQDRGNTNQATLEGGATSTMNGILYFPAANLKVWNGTNTTSYASIVTGSLTFAGGAKFKNYADLNSGSPLNSVKLAE